MENLPINSGEIFAPKEELEKIRQSPKEERWEKLKEFKEKLFYQKEGLAKLQESFISLIRKNPDIKLPTFLKQLDRFSRKFGLTAEQKNIARFVFNEYVQKHKAIKQIRKKYNNTVELYEALFGQKPKGEIEVIEGPMTLHFRCYNLEDYALIHSGKFIWDQPKLSVQDIKNAANRPGVYFSIGPRDHSLLAGIITAENAEKRKFDAKKSQKIFKHEEQHAISQLFFKISNYWGILDYDSAFKTAEKMEATQNLEQKKLIFENYLRNLRKQVIDERVKNEIISYLRSEGSILKALSVLTAAKKDGGYGFCDAMENYFVSAGNIFSNVPDFHHFNQTVLEKVLKKEFGQVVFNGVMAFRRLQLEDGYSLEKTIAFLLQEPLSTWPKIVQRLFGSKNIFRSEKAAKS